MFALIWGTRARLIAFTARMKSIPIGSDMDAAGRWSLVAGRWSPFRISPGLPIIPTRPLLASWSAALHTDDPQAALDLFPCSPRGGSPASSRLISGHPSGVLARSACFTTGRRAGCVQTVVVSRRSNLIHVACGMGERSQGLLHSIGGIVMASHHISD